MINTIIVDDEVWVCKLICNIVDWESLGYKITNQIYSGSEALDVISREKPDLVFTDIRMPGIDGITLIREIQKICPKTKFVIISGYSDFEYAKAAIDLNVLGYLLKPVEPDDLTALLLKLKNTAFENIPSDSSSLHDELKKSKHQFKEQFFYNFLLINPQPAYLSLEQFNAASNFSCGEGYFQVFSVMLDEKSDNQNCADSGIFRKITEQWYSILKPVCFDMCAIRINFSVICMINYSVSNQGKIKALVDEVFFKCKNYIPEISRYNITFGVGSAVKSFSEIAASFHCAQNAVRARMVLGTDKIIRIEDNQSSSKDIKELFPVGYKNLILRYLNHTCEYEADEIIAAVFEKFDKNKFDGNPCVLFGFALEFINSVYSTLADSRVSVANMPPQIIAQQKIEEFNSIHRLKEYLTEILIKSRDVSDSQKDKSISSIDILKNYIKEHFNENISLNDLADVVYLNPKYISELFKKETGTNFSDYIANVRIEKAKEFLFDPRCRINEIASMVGYSDIKYFSKLFKKIVGVTPSEFKKLHS